MLVLSRKRDEVIRINDDIAITVIEIRGDKVRLGVEAPKDITVHRQEVWAAIKREASTTATTSTGTIPGSGTDAAPQQAKKVG